jgi:hypothetical protein
MNKKLSLIISVTVIVLHLLVVGWMWKSFELEATRAAITYQRTDKLPKVEYPPGFNLLMFPIGHIAIIESGGILPVWGRLFQSAIWGALAFFLSKRVFAKKKKDTTGS